MEDKPSAETTSEPKQDAEMEPDTEPAKEETPELLEQAEEFKSKGNEDFK